MTRRRNKNHQPPVYAPGPEAETVKKLKTANVIAQNKEEVGAMILGLLGTKLSDVVDWDDAGNLRVKSAADLDGFPALAIKKIKQTRTKDGDPILEVELVDKVQLARIAAKAAGLLEAAPEDSDRPSIIGVNIKAPE